MKKTISRRLPGLLITVLLTIAVTLFMAILIQTKLLPGKLLLLAGAIFLMFVLIVCLLTRDATRTGSTIVGSFMTMILLITLMVGTPYLTKAVNALGNMTGINVEVTDVGIYVKNDSSLQALSDLSGKNVGIMEVLDRENTDKAVEQIQAEVGSMNVVCFPGLTEVVSRRKRP